MSFPLKRIGTSWRVQLPLVFGVVISSFLAAMLFMQWQLVSLGRTSLDLADNTAPSIEHLANARGELRHVDVLLHEYVEDAKLDAVTPLDRRSVEQARDAMNSSIAEYLVLPVQPGEQALWGDILHTKDAFNAGVTRVIASADRRDFDSADRELSETSGNANTLGAAITKDIAFNGAYAQALADQIGHERRQSMYVDVAVALLCVLIGAAGALAVRKLVRQRDAIAEQHRELLEARASELEQFAGRVAHDILSPMTVVNLALKTATSPKADDAMRKQLADRGASAIKRIERLVHGLLSFAVAGAKPDPDARADVAATVADLERELRDEASRAGAELNVDVNVAHEVACNAGVLMSVVSNLARNAIKYIGDAPVRRIDVRAFETKNAIRIEVQDTGPGLLPGLEARVFEPYVRGEGTGKTGIGLGLATVKRVVVAHGGHVGVKSTVGVGCTFWVELPKGDELPPPGLEAAPLVH